MGRFPVTYVLLVPRIAHKHPVVQAPVPSLTVVFLSFLVLAQGEGGVHGSGEEVQPPKASAAAVKVWGIAAPMERTVATVVYGAAVPGEVKAVAATSVA